jgi:DNA-binding NarL/FixJ family response regulator
MDYTVLWEPTCISVVTASVAAATTYLSLRSKLRTAELRSKDIDAMEHRLEELGNELRACRERLSETEHRYCPESGTFPGSASLHLNRRGQVTQLFRRGQSPRSIASALGISQGEVKLVIKLHELTQSPSVVDQAKKLSRKVGKTFDKAAGSEKGEL